MLYNRKEVSVLLASFFIFDKKYFYYGVFKRYYRGYKI